MVGEAKDHHTLIFLVYSSSSSSRQAGAAVEIVMAFGVEKRYDFYVLAPMHV